MSAERYVLYGDLRARHAAALAGVLVAKGISFEVVAATASLSFDLAARAGRREGPYLRTPEGFVLADLRGIFDWLERAHPARPLLPTTPTRRAVARLLEDWIDGWLPHWPRRSWSTLERLAAHLDRTGFLLGDAPVRADWRLAAWLETEVLVHADARAHVERRMPRLALLGDSLLGAREGRAGFEDDALPVSLLGTLEEVGADYGRYLERNHTAIKDRLETVELDLGLGRLSLPVQTDSERGRIAIGESLRALDRPTRRRVAGVLEPLGLWHVLTLPKVLPALDPSDPRSLD